MTAQRKCSLQQEAPVCQLLLVRCSIHIKSCLKCLEGRKCSMEKNFSNFSFFFYLVCKHQHVQQFFIIVFIIVRVIVVVNVLAVNNFIIIIHCFTSITCAFVYICSFILLFILLSFHFCLDFHCFFFNQHVELCV